MGLSVQQPFIGTMCMSSDIMFDMKGCCDGYSVFLVFHLSSHGCSHAHIGRSTLDTLQPHAPIHSIRVKTGHFAVNSKHPECCGGSIF